MRNRAEGAWASALADPIAEGQQTVGEVDVLNDIKAGGSVLCTAISDLDSSNVAVVDACEKLMAGEYVAKYNEIPYNIVTQDNVDEFLEKATAEAEKYAE